MKHTELKIVYTCDVCGQTCVPVKDEVIALQGTQHKENLRLSFVVRVHWQAYVPSDEDVPGLALQKVSKTSKDICKQCLVDALAGWLVREGGKEHGD